LFGSKRWQHLAFDQGFEKENSRSKKQEDTRVLEIGSRLTD
jgi:hypothetical protein